jgi:hypothetical protein
MSCGTSRVAAGLFVDDHFFETWFVWLHGLLMCKIEEMVRYVVPSATRRTLSREVFCRRESSWAFVQCMPVGKEEYTIKGSIDL